VNGLLGLGADFLEHISSPIYGIEVNEAYGQRLSALIRDNPEVVTTLASAKLAPDDVGTLSADAWVWYLDSPFPVPPDPLLHALYDQVPEPIVRLSVLQAVIGSADAAELFPRRESVRPLPISEFPVPWLRTRLEVVDDEVDPTREPPGPSLAAIELATYLLQLGDDISIQALRSLLDSSSSERSGLALHVTGVLNAAGLQEDELRLWHSRLGL